MRNPRVSVLVSLYNGRRYIGETLRSVFAQTFDDFEVIVVDDGSTDGGADYIAREFSDSRLILIRQHNSGPGQAIATALRHARGDWVAFLDHDDVWMDGKLERQFAAAAADAAAVLVFSDCLLIDADGRPFGRTSDRLDFRTLDLAGTRGYDELLRRGCFITMSTVMARADVVKRVGGVDPSYQYALDYDLWLRIARQHHVCCVPEILASWRVHGSQFTRRYPEVALAEDSRLLRPIYLSASFPRAIRVQLGDYLFGRHRDCCRALFREGRLWLAIRAAAGIIRYPDRVADYCRNKVKGLPIGIALDGTIAGWLRARDTVKRLWLRIWWIGAWLKVAASKIRRLLTGAAHASSPVPATPDDEATHVWIDGSPLADTQSGYFNLVSELARTLLRDPQHIVHVRTTAAGRAALAGRLGSDVSKVRFHRPGRSACHWSFVYHALVAPPALAAAAALSSAVLSIGIVSGNLPALAGGVALAAALAAHWLDDAVAAATAREPWLTRLVRFLWRRVPGPRGMPPHPNTVEVVIWRGLFRWRGSTRVAIVQDMTTRIHPDLHTPGNVREFDEFLRYVQRHAQRIATVSEHSRTDIIGGIAVYPASVSVMPSPLHPQYTFPRFNRGVLSAHGINGRYVLCVATIEPRKNLRRLVNAFELLKGDEALKETLLVLVGPPGWDEGFHRFLKEHDAGPRVRLPGFVATADLPSLYHFADAVIYPSLYEGFGLPVLEAMCCSAVTLTSRVSSLPEVLGRDGILFDPYSTEDIARALLQALSMPESAAIEYRRRCRRRAETMQEQWASQSPLPGLIAPAPRVTA